MPKMRLFKVEIAPTRGGFDVRAIGRSARGTQFIFDSIVVLDDDLTKEELREQLARATATLMSQDASN